MRSSSLTSSLLVSLLLASFVLALPAPTPAGDTEDWTRWGGPSQDFKAPAADIAQRWPATGPKRLWSRELGDGYSTVLVEGGRLYTMYRAGEEEAVICLDAESGKTLWERRYDHDPHENHVTQFGIGPRATPLVSGERIYTIGVAGRLHVLDKSTGEVIWSQDLWGEEFGGNLLPHGYASSPVEYADTVIALVGGENKSIVAFNKKDGSVAWQSLSFANSYATPKIFDIQGQDQLVTFMAQELVGVDPTNGELLWSHPVENQFQQNINPPTLVDGRYLFLSSLQAGSHGLELIRSDDGKTQVKELWSTRKIQFYHVTSVGDGDYVYGTSGGGSPAFMSAINVKTGEIPWRRRGFAKANTVFADGRVIVLDEDGKLYLTTATPEDMTIHSEVELLNRVAWTAPTIVGKTMYVRDKVNIMALDLSTETSSPDGEDVATGVAEAVEVALEAEATDVAEAAFDSVESSLGALEEDPNEPEALRILRKVDAATKAVSGVRYKATSKPSGAATNFAAPTAGDALMFGWTGTGPENFHTNVKSTRVGSDEPIELTAGGDGDLYFLIDHKTQKAYVDMDPNVTGSGGRTLGNIRMIEFIHPTPFDDEINGDKAELMGTENVAGVECYKIHVTYAGGQGESTWFFSTQDYLPRRRIRIFNTPQGEGAIDITVSELSVDPDVVPAAFKLELPEGYERVDDFAP
ncbi:MAG: PQQ-binding-like beta-propeller repeat protein [bacterium]|nr:PQQ-binding-like beta-propeller repeat protein [bacterium]